MKPVTIQFLSSLADGQLFTFCHCAWLLSLNKQKQTVLRLCKLHVRPAPQPIHTEEWNISITHPKPSLAVSVVTATSSSQPGKNKKKIYIYIYTYNKTNERRYFVKFIFGIGLYMFRTVSLSIMSTHSSRYRSYRLCWLLSSSKQSA